MEKLSFVMTKTKRTINRIITQLLKIMVMKNNQCLKNDWNTKWSEKGRKHKYMYTTVPTTEKLHGKQTNKPKKKKTEGKHT